MCAEVGGVWLLRRSEVVWRGAVVKKDPMLGKSLRIGAESVSNLGVISWNPYRICVEFGMCSIY